MEHAEWIWAAVAFGSGLLFGEIAGRHRSLRACRGVPAMPPARPAGAVGTFVFWTSTAVGLVVAIALIDSSVLEELGDRLADSLPRFLVAFLLLIGGYAVSVAVAAMIGQSARKATGVRQIGARADAAGRDHGRSGRGRPDRAGRGLLDARGAAGRGGRHPVPRRSHC